MTSRLLSLASRASLALALLLLFSTTVGAEQQQPPALASIRYRLTMERPASHLFGVSVEVELGEGTSAEYLDFQMPRWSPGRYSVFDFAKNVQEVQAAASICTPPARCDMATRPVTRLDDQTWRVGLLGAKSLTFSYKVFGDDLSGTFSQLDERHATFNGGSVFMYIVGHKPDPVRLSIDAPKSWRVVNGASGGADQREFSFPNYDILIDTPTEISPDWTMNEFKVDGKTYRVVVHSLGNEGGKRSQLVRDLEKIVRAETWMWGAPEFDTYTFLFHFANDGRSSDGMEHLVSTDIIEPGVLSDPDTYEDTLEAASHEFFHVWNVKRLRPVELGPWDFTRPVATRGLWVAEGVTEYYGELMLRRAGLWTDEQMLKRLGNVISGIENSQGSRLMSAEESSIVAPFLDGAVHVQRTNLSNTSVSYYYKGEVIALVLDLLLRGRTRGRVSLDDVMRRAYEELYLKSPAATYYLRGRGYTSEEFERITTDAARTDMSDFFKRYVRSVEVLPYDEALRSVGLRLVREATGSPTVGINSDFDEPRAMKVGSVREHSPAEEAGLEQGDIILAVGNRTVTRDTFVPAITSYKPNDRVTLTIKRNRSTIRKTIKLGEPSYTYRIEELKDATPEMRALRAAWLSGVASGS
ncbi:MAG: PDZ domain-containing protein [Acidobacteriota bacterium]|nr:PDZ domain-containing protein [Acidobacteriota bacterium]